MELLKSNKNVFWEALIICIFIFGSGILLGVLLENSRSQKISESYLSSEIDLLDIQILGDILNQDDFNCANAIDENIKFGDRIYEDAQILSRYESAERLTERLKDQHKRYDTLRTLFWINSVKIKEKCNGSFHTIVYLYDYSPESSELGVQQKVFSTALTDLKDIYGSRILLIPIAKNMNISSLNILINKYNLTRTSVIIDEKIVISDLEGLSNIEKHLS